MSKLRDRAQELAFGGSVRVELRPDRGEEWEGITPESRLRRALKALGRSYGLRAVTVVRLGPPRDEEEKDP